MTAVAVLLQRTASRSRRVVMLRAGVALAAVLLTVFYLAPRVNNLIAMPSRLDRAVVSANNYNPALAQIAAHEKETVEAFGALDRMTRSIDDVKQSDASVAKELETLVNQLRTDIRGALEKSAGEVDSLVGSLNELADQVDSLRSPVAGASEGVAKSSAMLGAVLADVQRTAAHVHATSASAGATANDLSGR
ncbi:hypothetical protein LTT66_31900 [Nocardia gipuzkoensis]|uniref:hypothetical protein n=1 Tax=Nocardia gipuzkoensis TaxID=2749991 RepID=UPI001E43B4EA|nr:hypothetical protein [Nocardia gipuzkoensis]UGT67749.1 hypothetical protein LTT66_31900 [Nocardia gipuzkoensis]